MISPARKKPKTSKTQPIAKPIAKKFPRTSLAKAVLVMEVPSRTCCNCGLQGKPPRHRTFSEQAWALLLLWKEITPSAVEQPICDACYDDLRETLMDRHTEVEHLLQSTEMPVAIARLLENVV